ncbi:unnamed protein product [Effrenium voratum]|nr:unnamed protein product [Effrenium voratum]
MGEALDARCVGDPAQASAHEILELLDTKLLEFSVVNAVTALHRIARAADGLQVRRDPRIHYLSRRITSMFMSSKKDEMEKAETGRRVPGDDWVYYIDTRSLCNASWAFAQLQLQHPELLEIISEETCRKIYDCSAQQLSMCAWSFAKLARKDFQLMQALAEETAQRLEDFSAQHLMTTVWACAKLIFLHVRLMAAIADTACGMLEDFTPQHLSITAWAYATLSFRHLGLMDLLAKEVLTTLRAFKPQNVANTAWAFATLHISSEDLFARLAEHALPKLQHYSPQNLSNLVWSYATLRLRADRLFQAVAKETCARIEDFDGRAISMVVSTYASLQLRHPGVFEAAASAASSRGGSFQARDLQSVLHALAMADVQAPELFEPAARRFVSEVHSLNSLDVSHVAVAFAKMHHDTEVFEALAARAAQLLAEGSVPSQALADLASVFPQHYLQPALAREAARKLSRHELRDLVALEASLEGPEVDMIRERLGQVMYHLLQALQLRSPAGQVELLRGLKVETFGQAGTAFFLQKAGFRVRCQGARGSGSCASVARLAEVERQGPLPPCRATRLQSCRQLRVGPLLDRSTCCTFQVLEAALQMDPIPSASLRLRSAPCVSCVGALLQFKLLRDLDMEIVIEPDG